MRLDVDTELLRAFLGVADLGGFTRAAAMLNRTQSAVSVQVQKLEARLGRTLFARAGRVVRLTPDGEEFCGYARRMLALVDEAAMAFATAGPAGSVRLGVMDDYATRILPALLSDFLRRTPAGCRQRLFRAYPAGELAQLPHGPAWLQPDSRCPGTWPGS
jgi:DNA-binding transcriptional LysR family regulator